MYLVPKNCSIFDASFFNDLQDHDVFLDSLDNLKISYFGWNTNTYTININTNAILGLINDSLPSIQKEGAWYPAYIDTDGSSQYKKAIYERINYTEPLLGIANFITFTAKFNNWRTDTLADTEVDRDMCCDWFLTSKYNNFKPVHGIIFWFKKVSNSQQSMSFYQMPAGTKFWDGGDLKQKLDSKRVKNLEIDRSTFSSITSSFSFNDSAEIEIFDYDFNGKAKNSYNIKTDGFDQGDDTYHIYVPDGEAFAFHDNQVSKLRAQSQSHFGFSYVSPSLYNIYREIDNALYPYSRGYSMGRKKSRAYQMLCSYLSTMPQTDRVTVDSLSKSSIKNRVIDFLDNCDATSDNEQITKLTNCIQDILDLSYINQTAVLNKQENVAANKKDLFHILTRKYHPELKIDSDTRLRYIKSDGIEFATTEAILGHHLSFSHIATAYYDPIYSPSMLKNNYTIFHGNSNDYMKYETNFTSTTSEATITAVEPNGRGYTKKVYYADVGIPAYSENPLYLGPGFLYTGDFKTNSFIEYGSNYAGAIPYDETNFNSVEANAFEATYSWRISAGPYGLRFHNIDSYTIFGTPMRVNSYNNSSEAEPQFVISQSGTYELECIRNIGAFSEIDRVILTTDPNYTLESDISASLSGGPSFKKINLGFSRSLAFDKAGFMWLIDTHHYINNGDISFNDDGNSRCMRAKDVKLFAGDANDNNIVFQNYPTNNYLYFDIKPGDTTLGLYSLNISSLRDEYHPRCLSTYKEKVIAKRPSWIPFNPLTPPILYTRGLNITRGSLQSREVDENGSSTIPPDPEACEECAQAFIEECLAACEEFSDNVAQCQDACTNEAGQANARSSCAPCSSQPRNVTDFSMNLDPNCSIPLITYGGYPDYYTGAYSEILGDSSIAEHEQRSLVNVSDRNDVFDPTGIYCYRENIAITGNEILLNKGLFHPNIGFIGPSNPDFVDNRSYVLEDRTEQFPVHIFDGRGFYDLRPAVTGINEHSSRITIPNFYRIDQMVNDDPRRYCGLYGYKQTTNESTKKTTAYLVNWDTPSGRDEDRVTGELQSSYTFYEDISIAKNIKNIEVNLNYLNYMNPKNLKFSLDCGISTDYDLYNTGTINDNTELTSYISSLDSTHSSWLYLLNQEHIRNYNFNYVIKFSDFYDKSIVAGTHHNSIGSYTHAQHSNLLNHNNEEYLQPTLFADNYGSNDTSLSMVNAIKHNNLMKSNYTLGRFRGQTIGGLDAKLKVEVVNQFDFRMGIKDNILSNDILSSLKSTNKRTTSNTINNSLCNWQLILHTGDDPGYHFKDALGMISYTDTSNYISNTNSFGPYNYIFQNNRQIPDININAPYNSIAGRTDCSYYDAMDELLGDTLAEMVGFPNLLGYLLLVTSFFGVTTGLGAAYGLQVLSMFYGNGGVNDPIINYFIQQRLAARAESLNEQYYRPVYTNFTYGKPDRAVVGLSNNKSMWYVTEVPIFKYTNTLAGKKEELFYVKLNKNSAFGAISSFRYELLVDHSQYHLLNCNYVLNKNVSSRNGAITVSRKRTNNHGTANVVAGSNDSKNQSIQLLEGDIVRLDGQTDTNQNGYYLVKNGNWTKFPNTSEIQFLQNNILYNSLDNDIQEEKVIMIDGFRAYYFFDINQSVLLADNTSATVENKALIATIDGYKTLLALDSAVAANISKGEIGLSDTECNAILVFNPEYVTSTSIPVTDINRSGNLDWLQDIEHIYKWPFQEHKKGLIATHYSSQKGCVGEGNIGYGTPILDYNVLSSESLKNKNWNLIDNCNNSENNQYKYFNFNLKWSIDDPANEGQTIPEEQYISFNQSDSDGDKLKAYRYSGKDLGFVSPNEGFSKKMEFIDSTDPIVPIDITSLDNHYNPLYSAFQKLAEANFIEIKTDKIKNLNLPSTGTIIIDKHLNFNNQIVYMSYDDYLLASGNVSGILDSSHGGYANFTEAKDGINLRSLRSFYKTLDYIEPKDCLRQSTFDADLCERATIKQRISSVTAQLSETQRALDICVTGQDLYSHVTATAVLKNNLYEISYKDNDYYWIHIDPENGCFVSNEMTVKIPTKTRYQILTSASNIAGQQIITDSQISPVSYATDYAVPNNDAGMIKLEDEFGGAYEITYTQAKQQEVKNAWLAIDPTLDFSNMVEISVGSTEVGQVDMQKMMFNYGDNFNDTLFAWRDYYERPAALGATYVDYKLKEVIDFNQPIYMKFRKMPSRKLKSHDQRFKKYYPTNDGSLARSVYPPSTNYDLATDFYCWRCVDNNGEYVQTPDFYKVMNETIFRGFFGSVDGVENTNVTLAESLEPWEYIPYEFHLCDTDPVTLGDAYVVSICNYNAVTDDDFDIYWNEVLIGNINLIPQTITDQVTWHIMFGSADRTKLHPLAGDCPYIDVRGVFTRPYADYLASNILKMVRTVDRHRGNSGSIAVYKTVPFGAGQTWNRIFYTEYYGQGNYNIDIS